MWGKKKLTKNTILEKTDFQPALLRGIKDRPMTPEERENKILYYRDLFWLTFRPKGVNGKEEEEIQFFYDRFSKLGALEVFYKLGLDYCFDRIEYLEKRIAKYPLLMDLYEKRFVPDKKDPGKKKRYMHKILKQQLENMTENLHAVDELKKQIEAIKKKMSELGFEIPPERKKTTVVIVKSESTVKPEVNTEIVSETAPEIAENVDELDENECDEYGLY